jgi:hypothetical protein
MFGPYSKISNHGRSHFISASHWKHQVWSSVNDFQKLWVLSTNLPKEGSKLRLYPYWHSISRSTLPKQDSYYNHKRDWIPTTISYMTAESCSHVIQHARPRQSFRLLYRNMSGLFVRPRIWRGSSTKQRTCGSKTHLTRIYCRVGNILRVQNSSGKGDECLHLHPPQLVRRNRGKPLGWGHTSV